MYLTLLLKTLGHTSKKSTVLRKRVRLVIIYYITIEITFTNEWHDVFYHYTDDTTQLNVQNAIFFFLYSIVMVIFNRLLYYSAAVYNNVII
jgi:hypothetical protein